MVLSGAFWRIGVGARNFGGKLRFFERSFGGKMRKCGIIGKSVGAAITRELAKESVLAVRLKCE